MTQIKTNVYHVTILERRIYSKVVEIQAITPHLAQQEALYGESTTIEDWQDDPFAREQWVDKVEFIRQRLLTPEDKRAPKSIPLNIKRGE